MTQVSLSRRWAVGALVGLLSGARAVRAEAPVAPVLPRAAAEHPVRYESVRVQGLDIFYREAGPPDAPVVLLLHGFPSSSFMFRDLIPRLASSYRVIAPDYPGFGQSSQPSRASFVYSFEHLASVLGGFVDALGLARYALYVQDYGAPLGFRLALAHPERVRALVVQNGNAYEEGLAPEAWAPLQEYWRDPSPARREKLRGWLSEDGIRQQYLWGTAEAERARFSPDTWTLDWARLQRPEALDIQLDLFADYATNVALYPRFQAFFRKHRPPTLIVWGKRDPFFAPAGALAYQRDLPGAELVWLDAGHFALETHAPAISERMRAFFARSLR